MRKLPLIIILGAVLLTVAVLTVPFGGTALAGPDQPIGFTHATHAGTLQIQCAFCHRNVETGNNASVPGVGQCMFCHKVVNGDNPKVTDPVKKAEIDKVVKAATSDPPTPINWVRVHRVPDHVRFVHEAHITKGFPCSTCHGDVANTPGKISQVRSLGMGDCMTCHRVNGGPTDCSICHK